jgi:hypothetical protein
MNLGEGNRRIGGDDLGGRHAHPVVPHGNVSDLDAVPKDVWLPTAITGTDPDGLGGDGQGCLVQGIPGGCRFHNTILSGVRPARQREPHDGQVLAMGATG